MERRDIKQRGNKMESIILGWWGRGGGGGVAEEEERGYHIRRRPLEYLKTEIISSIFSKHNTMRLEINYKKKKVKNTNTWRPNNMLLNNQGITEKIRGN